MKDLKYVLFSFVIAVGFSSCCRNDDTVDNTVIIQVFNLDKSDNLLDDDGLVIFDARKLIETNTNAEINCLTDFRSPEFAFLPLDGQRDMSNIRINDLTIQLDSLSYLLSITYEVQELKCSGMQLRVVSYNFEGQEFNFDEDLGFNTIELLLDI